MYHLADVSELLTQEELAELLEPIATKSQTVSIYGVANSIGNIRRKRILTYRKLESAYAARDDKRTRGHSGAFVFEIKIDLNNIVKID